MKSPEAGRIRQALRSATSGDHQRVDDLFAGYALDSATDYRAFLTAHARAVAALEPAARPDAPRLSLLEQDMAALDAAMPESLPVPSVPTPAFRWGLLYALEGSRLGGAMLGGAMLARRVGADLPTAYLSAVHGKGEWIAFQHALDAAAAEGGEGWLDDAVQGAQTAFALFAAAAEAQRMTAHG